MPSSPHIVSTGRSYVSMRRRSIALVEAARAGLDAGSAESASRRAGELIVAGSVDGPEQIQALAAAGADGFTVGSAVFDGSFAPGRGGTADQVQAILDCLD